MGHAGMNTNQPLLILVPARSEAEADPLFLQSIGDCQLIDVTLRDAEALVPKYDIDLCVTTDDSRVHKYISDRSTNWNVRMREAAERGGDYFLCLDVARRWMTSKTGRQYANVLILEPSHPFRPTGLLENALGMMRREFDLDTVVSVVAEYGNIWTEQTDGGLHRLTTPTGKRFFREVAGLCLLTKPATLASQSAMGRSVGFVVVEEQWALIDIHGNSGIELARQYHSVLTPNLERN